jgi:hypothetical protein
MFDWEEGGYLPQKTFSRSYVIRKAFRYEYDKYAGPDPLVVVWSGSFEAKVAPPQQAAFRFGSQSVSSFECLMTAACRIQSYLQIHSCQPAPTRSQSRARSATPRRTEAGSVLPTGTPNPTAISTESCPQPPEQPPGRSEWPTEKQSPIKSQLLAESRSLEQVLSLPETPFPSPASAAMAMDQDADAVGKEGRVSGETEATPTIGYSAAVGLLSVAVIVLMVAPSGYLGNAKGSRRPGGVLVRVGIR